MSKRPDVEATAKVVASLSPAEQAALPSRLRALVADDYVAAWAQAKAERDAALRAALELEDPDERVAALEAAKEAWQARKAELLAED